MRETRQSGSEGGATELNQSFLPLSFGCGYTAPFCSSGNYCGLVPELIQGTHVARPECLTSNRARHGTGDSTAWRLDRRPYH